MKKLEISLIFMFILIGCGGSNKPKTIETETKTLFNSIEVQIPIGFVQEDDHNWLYKTDKTVGRIYFSQFENPDGKLGNILSEFREEMFETPLSDFELIQEDSINTNEKQGLIKLYRKNENDGGTFPVYTYHSVGILKYNSSLFKIRSVSLGFNLNPTIHKIFFKISKVGSQISSSNYQISNEEMQNFVIYEVHSIAVPDKLKFKGEINNEKLGLRFEDGNREIVYYLTSSKLPNNIELGYYLKSYTQNLENEGYAVEKVTYKNKRALRSELVRNGNYVYQLHFVNNGKAQSLMMLARQPMDNEFQEYIDSAILIN